ncbi:MAG: hypothetical protein HZC41_23470 [Chloroflexi bacterium]|nr:hypothetical protein [Chloroflexota bacterium]
MGITVGWGDAACRSLVVTFARPWNWTDFQAAVDQMLVQASSINHRADLILDIRQAGFPPEGAMRRFRDVSETEHPNIDRIIYVAPRPLAQFVKSINALMSAAFFGHRAPGFIFVTTPEEAQALVLNKSQPAAS